jgi:hypothetical protein
LFSFTKNIFDQRKTSVAIFDQKLKNFVGSGFVFYNLAQNRVLKFAGRKSALFVRKNVFFLYIALIFLNFLERKIVIRVEFSTKIQRWKIKLHATTATLHLQNVDDLENFLKSRF